MFELVVLGALAFAAIAILGLVSAVAALICWVIFLPFKLLGLVFRGIGVLLVLPFLLLLGGVLAVVVGVPLLLVLVVPALPVVLLVLAVVWLARRGFRPPIAADLPR